MFSFLFQYDVYPFSVEIKYTKILEIDEKQMSYLYDYQWARNMSTKFFNIHNISMDRDEDYSAIAGTSAV